MTRKGQYLQSDTPEVATRKEKVPARDFAAVAWTGRYGGMARMDFLVGRAAHVEKI